MTSWIRLCRATHPLVAVQNRLLPFELQSYEYVTHALALYSVRTFMYVVTRHRKSALAVTLDPAMASGVP